LPRPDAIQHELTPSERYIDSIMRMKSTLFSALAEAKPGRETRNFAENRLLLRVNPEAENRLHRHRLISAGGCDEFPGRERRQNFCSEIGAVGLHNARVPHNAVRVEIASDQQP